MNSYKLRHIIKKGEGPKVDFKASIKLLTDSEKKELARDIIAIANTRGGRGYLIFGVEDKTKKIIGVEVSKYKEEQIQQIIYNRCDPPVPVSVDFVKIEGKTVAVITIYKSNHQPHQMIQNGAFYLRRGSTTDTARRSELANMLQQNGLMTFETVLLKLASIEDLDIDVICDYLESLNVFTKDPSKTLLEAIGIIGREIGSNTFYPTIGGMLLFGKNPIVSLPHVYIKVDYGKKGEYFYGNVIKILNNISEYIEKNIDDKKYQIELLIELIANAVIHRDYMDFSRGINITIREKTIEITNPGALYAANSFVKNIKDGNPIRRNSWLYQRLILQDTKNRFVNTGIGLSKLKENVGKFKNVNFINIGSKNLFKVVVREN